MRISDWSSDVCSSDLDFLMGEGLSSTSRAMLVAPTGLGKTNLCMALAFAMAEGRDFLHWRAHRPCSVLYIDGEMSRRLVKIRLARSEEHTSELQSLMRISYAVFCLTKNTNHKTQHHIPNTQQPE